MCKLIALALKKLNLSYQTIAQLTLQNNWFPHGWKNLKAFRMLKNEHLLFIPQRVLNSLRYYFRSYFYEKIFNAKNMRLGMGTQISGTRHIKIGNNFSVGRMLWMYALNKHNYKDYSPEIKIGNNVNLSDFVHIGAVGKINIGNNVLIGSNVLIIDHNHGSYKNLNQDSPMTPPSKRQLNYNGPIIVEDNVFIGDSVVIMSNTHIGFGSIIASGTFINVGTTIPPNSIIAGNPPKIIKHFNENIQKWEKINTSIGEKVVK